MMEGGDIYQVSTHRLRLFHGRPIVCFAAMLKPLGLRLNLNVAVKRRSLAIIVPCNGGMGRQSMFYPRSDLQGKSVA